MFYPSLEEAGRILHLGCVSSCKLVHYTLIVMAVNKTKCDFISILTQNTDFECLLEPPHNFCLE